MNEQPTNNRPELIAYHVQGQGKQANWIKIGAAWATKDGEGFSLQLETLPLPINSFQGRIVLRKPREQ